MMTELTAFLREETLSGRNKAARCLMPALDVSGEPGGIPVRKAKAFRLLCREMPLYIGPRELIVGTRTFFGPQAEPGDPVDWSCPPLTVYPKFITEEDIRCFGGDFSKVNSQHYTPDFGILLEKGIGGIMGEAELRKTRGSLRPDQLEFLDSVVIVYQGLGDLIRRYSAYAIKLSAEAEGPEQQRLLEIGEVCAHIAEKAPRTFREAVQLLWFGHLGTILESGLFINYGRLDVILEPFLGDTPWDEARQLLECFLLKLYDQADIRDHTYITMHHGQLVMTLGGVHEDGSSAVSPVTMLFLEAVDSTRLPEPELNLRISPLDPPEYLDLAARLTATGCNFISYYNDEAVIDALVSAGLSPEEARGYGFDLCQDLTFPGKGDPYNIYGVSLAQDLMDLLRERSFASFEALMEAFKEKQARQLADTMPLRNLAQEALLRYGSGDREGYFRLVADGADGCWEGRHPMCPLPYLSGLFHGCVENAMDMIYESYPIKHKGGILGTAVEAVNSLAAIRQVVFDRGLYPLEEVVRACEADFEGFEELRCHLWNAPKWGNDDPYVDLIAKDLLEYCLREFEGYRTFSGGKLLSGIHQPHPVATGWGLMATPDGRRKGAPVAVTMTPQSGTLRQGATAALKSASIFDHRLLQWNYCVMINYYASVFSGPQGQEVFKSLLQTYFRRGGVQHQPNVMDARTLRAAQLEPEKYKDLIVRLWGVSAHFVDLSKELQDELIARLQ